MAERRILHLSARRLAIHRGQDGEVHTEGCFEPTPAGLAAFADHVRSHPKSLYTLLADTADEAFHTETIPCLQAADRRAVIARKLAQRFRGTPYTAALSLGRETGRRKDERLLLAALTAPDALSPWLEILREQRAPLTGLYSLPFVGAELLRQLDIADEHCLLLTVQEHNLRESYFRHGLLNFSRQLPLGRIGAGSLAQTLASEAEKLRQYLISQRLIARNQALRAVVIVHPQTMAAVSANCVNSEALGFEIRSSDDCAHRVGLKTPPTDGRLDAVYVHLVARTPPAVQFAGAPLRHDYRLRQFRIALYGLGAAVLAACLLFAGKQAIATFALDGEAVEMRAQAQSARQSYEAIVRTFPPMPISNDALRRTVDRYAELERAGTPPNAFYRELGAALAQAPAVELEAMDWKAGDDGTQTMQLRGSVAAGQHATPRQLQAAFRRFIDALAANPSLTVMVSQQPFDVESGKALRGGEGGAGEARPFALQIVRRSGA